MEEPLKCDNATVALSVTRYEVLLVHVALGLFLAYQEHVVGSWADAQREIGRILALLVDVPIV